jgi:hypothetical protein
MCESCGYRDYLRELDDMIEDRRYEKAQTTLNGISDFVVDHNHITERQILAIKNIKEGFKDEH